MFGGEEFMFPLNARMFGGAEFMFRLNARMSTLPPEGFERVQVITKGVHPGVRGQPRLHRQFGFSRPAYQFAVKEYRSLTQLRLGLAEREDKKELAQAHQKELNAQVKALRAQLKGKEKDEVAARVKALRKDGAYPGREKWLRQFFAARFLHTAMDACSVPWWADMPEANSARYNALVHGGRCNNENPLRYAFDQALDVDICGCYGETTRRLSFPLGLPTVWSFTSNQARTRLGDWLAKWQAELVPDLWTATINGKLPFEQDLLYSKLVKPRDIFKAALAGDEGRDINSDFALLRREIKNGLLTADLLNTIRRISTSAEWAAWMNLEVVTAVAYLRRDRLDGIEAWCAAVLHDRGEFRCGDGGNIQDGRTRAWLPVSLEEFVGRLADERKRYQARAKAGDSTAKGMDSLLKLTVNMVYGDLSARYFPIGNTVLANNITARARLGVWMMGKALALRETITDGGPYEPARVCFFKDKRPGFDTLSRIWEWPDERKRYRWLGPLGGRDWRGDEPKAQVDQLTQDHVRQFWEPYGLGFPFKLEHKNQKRDAEGKEVPETHWIEAGAYWHKGDYAFRLPDGMVNYALRGKDKKGKKHPTFTLLANILRGDNTFPTDLNYTHKAIMRLGKFRVAQASATGYGNLKPLRPGDDYREGRIARYNNNHFPLADEADYHCRRNRKKIQRGRPKLWFEKFAALGIEQVHRNMTNNRLK
jgi:hypothetical protein